MNEITETMLKELDNSCSMYNVSNSAFYSHGCACGYTCTFSCDATCWDSSAMGF